MNKSIAEMLKKGYILFPKVLFEEQMKMTKNATGSFEAFILVLTHVNYSTVTCRVNGQTFECRRGESVISLTHCHLRGFLGEISRGNPETKGQYRPCQTGMEETFSPRTQYEHTAD